MTRPDSEVATQRAQRLGLSSAPEQGVHQLQALSFSSGNWREG
jgi:hypothetical protein